MTVPSLNSSVRLAFDTGEVYVCSFSPDRSRLLAGAHDNPIGLFVVDTGEPERSFEGHRGGVWALSWKADATQFLSGAFDATVRLWDIDSGRCVDVFTGHTDY